uniref:Uncharacterized protein n=1 Tax=Cacopsylla melanoneura TaxID=428564 RepID=A0A8D8TYS5_9HEMI
MSQDEDDGVGGYDTELTEDELEANRPRPVRERKKRGRKPGKGENVAKERVADIAEELARQEEEEERRDAEERRQAETAETEEDEDERVNVEERVKKNRRGRPGKAKVEPSSVETEDEAGLESQDEEMGEERKGEKRRRGRPAKVK